MQSGVLTADNLADVLRGISQRRRQGVLEIQSPDGGNTVVKFIQGRVVEAYYSKLSPIQETVEWLQSAGYPVLEPKEYHERSYSELLSRLSRELAGEFKVTAELLAHVVKHRVHERLYKIDVGAGALYTFKVQMVEQEDQFSTNISVGQLLLDLVELSAEREDFVKRFPETAIIRALCSVPDAGDRDETYIIRSIQAGCSLEELERKCLLSSYHFRHALLELLSTGKIEVLVSQKRDSSQDHSAVDSFLTTSVDAAFAEGLSNQPAAEDSGTLKDLADESAEEFLPEQSRAVAVQLLSARMLQSSSVPSVLGVAYLIIGILAPFVAWHSIVRVFSE